MTALLRSRILANVFGAGGVRVISMLVAVFSVPLLLQLLGTADYGLWVTLTSVLTWFVLLDLGVGNSVRNSVAGMVSPASVLVVQQEFRGLFRLLCLIACAAVAMLLVAAAFFPLLQHNLPAVMVLYIPALLLLPFLLGGSVLQGAGRVAFHAMLQSANSWIFFIFIVVCHMLAFRPTLGVLAFVWSTIFLVSATAIFLTALRLLKWNVRGFFAAGTSAVPAGRLKVGVSFLVLQVSTLVLYGVGNVIIYGSLGAEEVARYDVLNKIFQIGLGFYTIVIAVMWAEIARRRALQDFAALKRIYFRMLGLATFFSLGAFAVAAFVPFIIRIWTAKIMEVSLHESFALAILVSVQAIAYVGAVFLNAFEQVRIQLVLSCLSIVLMLPLSNYLIGAGKGIAAVPLAAAILTFLPMLACNIYAYRMLRNTDHAEKNI